MSKITSKKAQTPSDVEWVDLLTAPDGSRFQIPRENFDAPRGWLYSLWTAFLHMALNGTAHYRELDEFDRRQFEEFVNRGMLFSLVETLKRKAVAEAAAFGQEVPIQVLAELSAASVRFGVLLRESVRDRLRTLATIIYGLIVRLDGLEGSLPKGGLLHGRIRKARPLCRNEDRDAWVAKKRKQKQPPPWAEIYDDGVRLAAKRGWDMPAGWKALSKAHYDYMKRQRERGKD